MTAVTEDWEQRLARAERSLRAGDLAAAAVRARELGAEAPEHPAPLYLLAVCARFAGEAAAARSYLERLLQLAPSHARAHQESGHLYRDAGDAVAAVAAYRRALQGNPALLAGWKALARLLAGQVAVDDKAALLASAREHIERLSALPPELLAASSKLYEGKLYQGEQLCRAFLQKHPHHPEAMRLLALLGVRLRILDDAEFLLESCLELYPDFHRARLDYVDVLHRRQKYEPALAQARQLLAVDAGNPAYRLAYANESMALGHYDAALSAYAALLEQVPDPAGIHLAMGHAHKTRGDGESGEEAVTQYRRAYAARPDFGDAYWSLANLKTYRFQGVEIKQMERAAEAAATGHEDRFHLCFALGKAHEDAGEYDRAFHWYARGNALKRSALNYSAERVRQEMREQRDTCDAALFSAAATAGGGCPAPDPIFIVGLPRAGSTLLEQILSSHSQVDGTFELPNVLAIAHRLGGRRRAGEASRYPGNLAQLGPEQRRQLGEQYLADTAVYRAGAPFFTDKMPNNFRHLGLIALMLPRARIIDARRHPMACCFSGFKQLFAEGQEFSYSLEDIGQYYRDYVALMDHWENVLPGRIHRVQHEDLLADFEGEVRRLLDFCGLPFERACLDFYRSTRSVRTASAEQVRRPLQRDGVEAWRRFSRHLDALRDALGDVLERYPE